MSITEGSHSHTENFFAGSSGGHGTAQEQEEEIRVTLEEHQPIDIVRMKETIVASFRVSVAKSDSNALNLQKILSVSPYSTWNMALEDFDSEVYHAWSKWETSNLTYYAFSAQFGKAFNQWLIDKWGGATRAEEGTKKLAKGIGGFFGSIFKGTAEGIFGGGGVYIVLAVVVVGAIIYVSAKGKAVKAVTK